MRAAVSLAALAVVVACPGRSSALWSIAELKPADAKKLGVEVRATPGGPNHVTVEIEFPADGPLKGFSRVELRVGTGDNPPVTAPLREDRSKPGRVVVTFTADRAKLDELAVWVMVPELDGGSIYDLRPKDFVPRGRR